MHVNAAFAALRASESFHPVIKRSLGAHARESERLHHRIITETGPITLV